MNLILYHIFGEKFIAFLILIAFLEIIVMAGIAIFVLFRIVLEEFSQPHPHPKK